MVKSWKGVKEEEAEILKMERERVRNVWSDFKH